jgi:hypothetical protein
MRRGDGRRFKKPGIRTCEARFYFWVLGNSFLFSTIKEVEGGIEWV